jgi:Signal transduction histidine kinase
MEDQELFIIIIISVFVMVTLAIGVLVLYNTSQRRILKEVEGAHMKEIEYKNNLLANSIEVQERERSRIAKDLHDDIGSKLSVVNLNINLLQSHLNKNEQVSSIIGHIETSLSESITRVRDISHNLYPPILEKFGIQSALESLAKEVTRTGVLRVHLEIDHEWKKFDKASELHIYRINQELLHNTIKHAEAKHVWISSQSEGDQLRVFYKDDGKGVDKDHGKSDGLGISSILTRVNILNATVKFHNEYNEGYKVEFVF